MSLWGELIDFALDNETLKNEQEQLEWIGREPDNPRPYFHLALLRRMQYKQDEGFALLLQAVKLDAKFAPAHAGLAEIYAINGDCKMAWKHARAASENGDERAVEMLRRHGVEEQ